MNIRKVPPLMSRNEKGAGSQRFGAVNKFCMEFFQSDTLSLGTCYLLVLLAIVVQYVQSTALCTGDICRICTAPRLGFANTR